jgi:hypothetical protein
MIGASMKNPAVKTTVHRLFEDRSRVRVTFADKEHAVLVIVMEFPVGSLDDAQCEVIREAAEIVNHGLERQRIANQIKHACLSQAAIGRSMADRFVLQCKNVIDRAFNSLPRRKGGDLVGFGASSRGE